VGFVVKPVVYLLKKFVLVVKRQRSMFGFLGVLMLIVQFLSVL